MTEIRHRALHILFNDDLPIGQFKAIVDINGKALNRDFAQDIITILDDYGMDAYNPKCFKR
jgi:hypothetical protein